MRLDNDYANAPFIPGAEGFIERWKSQAAAFRADMLARDAARRRARAGARGSPRPEQRRLLLELGAAPDAEEMVEVA